MSRQSPSVSKPQSQVDQVQRLERLALVAERSSNAVVLADADRGIVWVNQAFATMTGLSQQECLGQHLGRLMQRGNMASDAYAQFRDAVVLGRGLKQEVCLRARNGEARWALVDMQPLHSDTGELSGWVVIATDFTDMRAQQQLLALAVDGAGLGTWQWEVSTGVMQCNDRLLEIIGYQREQLPMTADVWNANIHPDDLAPWLAAVNAQIHDPVLELRRSVRVRQSSGRWVWIMLVGAVVDRSSNGHALRMAGVALDVQAQKAMEQELRTAGTPTA